jgi:hypothetical protein
MGDNPTVDHRGAFDTVRNSPKAEEPTKERGSIITQETQWVENKVLRRWRP